MSKNFIYDPQRGVVHVRAKTPLGAMYRATGHAVLIVAGAMLIPLACTTGVWYLIHTIQALLGIAR